MKLRYIIERKLILFITIIIWSVVFSLVSFQRAQQVQAWDLMEKAFKQAQTYETILDLWLTKEAVWNEVLREWVNMSVSMSEWIEVDLRAPLIVRIAKFILRITIVLSITMVIVNWIYYIVESSKWSMDVVEPRKNLINIAIWIILALSSLGIINLISSIWISSLNTAENTQNKCIIDGVQMKNDEIKKIICEEIRLWERKQGRIWDRCNINNKRESISDDEIKTYCTLKNLEE
jgi:hypothetical protein